MSLDFNLSVGSKREKLSTEVIYDVIIIGGGPAGLNAALYSKRKGLNVGIVADRIGGQVLDTASVENYLGFEFKTGEDLMKEFEKHVDTLKIPMTSSVLVEKVEDGKVKKIFVNDGTVLQTKTIIIATGSKPRALGVPGEMEFLGRGVAFCAICDGPLFTDREVIIAGGGNSAVEAAIDLSKIAAKVKLVHRSQFRADQILVDNLLTIDNVEVFLNTQIKEIKGDMLVSHVVAFDKDKDKEIEIPSEGVFVEIGYLPKSDVFKDLVALNDRGEIIVNDRTETNVPGIFAAGDVAIIPYKQIIISAAEGAKAALSANEYLNKN